MAQPKYKLFDLVATRLLSFEDNSDPSYFIGWITGVYFDEEEGWTYSIDWCDGLMGQGRYLESVITDLRYNLLHHMKNNR